MSAGCIFCRIINKEASAEIVYEDQDIIAFKDINPAAPVHLLVVPRKHIPTLDDLEENDIMLIGRLHLVVSDLARAFNLDQKGYRVVVNCGQDAGQVVFHLHFHLLGGKPLQHNAAKGLGA